ncbi:MAG: sulfite exporter TauE/SafE family protein [Bacteroidota bacterium]
MLFSALILGLLGSLHCVGMCGPIAFLLPVDRTDPVKKAGQTFLYHFGRILAYSIMGLLFGWLGKGLYLFGMQQWLSISIGLLMILVVALPKKTWNRINLSKSVSRGLFSIKNKLGSLLKKKSADAFLTLGFLNGFLPCGLVYMAIFGAVAMGSGMEGSAYMALFGLGTIPMMTAAVYMGSVITQNVKRRIRRSIPVFVVIIGCLFVLRGMGLGIPYVSPKLAQAKVGPAIECHDASQQLNENHLKQE